MLLGIPWHWPHYYSSLQASVSQSWAVSNRFRDSRESQTASSLLQGCGPEAVDAPGSAVQCLGYKKSQMARLVLLSG